MNLAEPLANEIRGYIKNLIGKESILIGANFKVLSSSKEEDIGSTLNLTGLSSDLTVSKIVEYNHKNMVILPLRNQSKIAAFLLFDASPDVDNYVPLIKSFAELLIQQYYENNKPILDSTDRYIAKLLTSYVSSEAKSYEAEANLLGYDLARKRLAILVYLKGFWDNCLLDLDQPSFERDEVIKNWKRNIEQSLNSFFTKNSDLIIAYLGNDRFCIFKTVESGDEEATRKLLKKSYKSIFLPLRSRRIESVTVGFGNAYDGIEGLIAAKREAELTLDLGQRIWGENQSYYFGELGLLSIIGDGDREKKITFSNQILSHLKNDELNKTLECFFDNNLNLTETAESMGIHRNTVIYRLNQISKALNADPRVFEQAMSIKIALLIKSLFN